MFNCQFKQPGIKQGREHALYTTTTDRFGYSLVQAKYQLTKLGQKTSSLHEYKGVFG